MVVFHEHPFLEVSRPRVPRTGGPWNALELDIQAVDIGRIAFRGSDLFPRAAGFFFLLLFFELRDSPFLHFKNDFVQPQFLIAGKRLKRDRTAVFGGAYDTGLKRAYTAAIKDKNVQNAVLARGTQPCRRFHVTLAISLSARRI